MAALNSSLTAGMSFSNMTSLSTSLPTLVNSTNETECIAEESSLLYDITMLDKIFKPIMYILGFPGNAIAFIVWIRPKMRHSSGVYLATLALVDFIFLILNLLLYLNESWGIQIINFPVICESFTVFYMTFQYLAPSLVLAFTIERYISICHPFKREKYCTTKGARIVSIILALVSLSLSAVQGYFWQYGEQGCGLREELTAGNFGSIWSIWSMATELLLFLIVPLCVLTFNIFVIKETRRLSKYEPGQVAGRHQKTSATTIMLLAVSFYLIVTTLPASIVYIIVWMFSPGPLCASHETHPVWRQYYMYELTRDLVEDIASTHFALNCYIYFITGKQFRKEFCKMCRSVLGKSLPEKVRTEYSYLRTSIGDSFKKTVTVRMAENGNGVNDKEDNGNETHV